MSWVLDGSWRVAFTEGAESRYSFDAHGHCLVEMPSSSLPVSWKAYDQAFIPSGSDLEGPTIVSVADAKERCRQHSKCKGITYDEASHNGNNEYEVWFKLVTTVAPAPGTGWKSFVEDKRPELHEIVSVAGPLTQVTLNVSNSFRFDLHGAAPLLFPMGCFEVFSINNDQLHVERRCPGMAMQSGFGLHTK
jgi:hypothetical protein